MATLVTAYVSVGVVGGAGDGTSWANAYGSLYDAVEAEKRDLVAADEQLTILVRTESGAAESGLPPAIDDTWNTDATRYLEVRNTILPTGTWNTTAWRMDRAWSASTFTCTVRYTKLVGLQVRNTNTASTSRAVTIGPMGAGDSSQFIELDRCIADSASGYPIQITGTYTCVRARNVLGIGIGNTNRAVFTIGVGTVAPDTLLYHCTAIGGTYGFQTTSGDSEAQNCASIDGGTGGWTGTFTAASTNNSSDNNDAAGSNPVNGEPTMLDKAGGDYRLATGDTVCKDAGVDLSGDATWPVAEDCEGTSRPQGSTSDIGYSEVAAASVTWELNRGNVTFEYVPSGFSDASAFDGLALIRSTSSLQVDGSAVVGSSASAQIDGLAAVRDDEAVQIDGLAVVQDDEPTQIDGLAVVKDAEAVQVDGRAVVSQTASETAQIDGLAAIEGAETPKLDGLGLVWDSTTYSDAFAGGWPLDGWDNSGLGGGTFTWDGVGRIYPTTLNTDSYARRTDSWSSVQDCQVRSGGAPASGSVGITGPMILTRPDGSGWGADFSQADGTGFWDARLWWRRSDGSRDFIFTKFNTGIPHSAVGYDYLRLTYDGTFIRGYIKQSSTSWYARIFSYERALHLSGNTNSSGTIGLYANQFRASVEAEIARVDAMGVLPNPTPQIDGRALVQAAEAAQVDGQAVVRSADTPQIDGLATVKDTALPQIDGLTSIVVAGESFQQFDGRAALKSAISPQVDGLTKILLTVAPQIDGSAVIRDAVLPQIDGLAVVLSSAAEPSQIDGLAIVKGLTSPQLDGRGVVRSLEGAQVDGLAVVRAVDLAQIDGRTIVESAATLQIDGLALVQGGTTSQFDGLTTIRGLTAPQVDGRAVVITAGESFQQIDGLVTIKDTTSPQIDGLARIALTTSSQVDGWARIVLTDSPQIDGRALVRQTVGPQIDGWARVALTDTEQLDGQVQITLLAAPQIDGQAVVEGLTRVEFDGQAVVKSAALTQIDGRGQVTVVPVVFIIKADGRRGSRQVRGRGGRRRQAISAPYVAWWRQLDAVVVIKGADTPQLDAWANVKSEDASQLDGLADIELIETEQLDGRAKIQVTPTPQIDGQATVKSTESFQIEGQTNIGSYGEPKIDGKATVKDTGSEQLDGKAAVQDTTSEQIDGRAAIGSETSDQVDGRAVVASGGSQQIDGQAVIRDAEAAQIDAEARVKDSATPQIDGLTNLGAYGEPRIDGRATVQDETSGQLDGKAVVGSEETAQVDGRAVIGNIEGQQLDAEAVVRGTDAPQIDGQAVIGSTETVQVEGLANIGSFVSPQVDGSATVGSFGGEQIDGKANVQDTILVGLSAGTTAGRIRTMWLPDAGYMGQDDSSGNLNTSSITATSSMKTAIANCGLVTLPFSRAWTNTGQFAIGEYKAVNPSFEYITYIQIGHVSTFDPGPARQVDQDVSDLLEPYIALDIAGNPVVAWRSGGDIHAYWANYTNPTGGEIFDKNLLDAQIEIFRSYVNGLTHKPAGFMIDYINPNSSGPYAYDGQTIDFDQDGTPYASDANEIAAFTAAQEYYLDRLAAVFGENAFVISNGKASWYGEQPGTASRMHAGFREGWPTTPWSAYRPAACFANLQGMWDDPTHYKQYQSRSTPLFSTDLRPPYVLSGTRAMAGRIAAMLYDGWYQHRPAMVEAEHTDSQWDDIVSACGAPTGAPFASPGGNSMLYGRNFTGGLLYIIVDPTLGTPENQYLEQITSWGGPGIP